MSEQAERYQQAMQYFEGKQIHVAPYCHPDYSWTHTRNWHISRYTLVLNEVCDLLERYPEYRYYVDCYASFIEPVLQRCPELAMRIQKYIDQGRFAVCGTYANVRPNMVDGEAFVRNMQIGRRAFNELWSGLDICVYADTADVCAGFSQLPQLLQQGGYRYLRFLRPGDVFTHKGVPWDHIYRGQDGSEVLVTLATICGFFIHRLVKPCFDEDIEASISALYENEFAADAPRFTSNIILKGHGVDDVRPMRAWDSPEWFDFPTQMEKWRKAGIDIRFSTPNDYFKALEQQRDRLTVVDKPVDIADVCFNVCLGGEQSLQHKRLYSAQHIVAAEKWNAAASLLGICEGSDHTPLWKENLFCSHHASQWAYKPDSADLHKRIDRVSDKADEERERTQRAMTAYMPFDLRKTAVVFNPFDKPIRRAVRLVITSPDPDKVRLCDGAGKPLAAQAVYPYCNGMKGTRVWEWDYLVALDIPANGYNCITVQNGCIDATEAFFRTLPAKKRRKKVQGSTFALQNDVLCLTFVDGALQSILRKDTGALLQGGSAFNGMRFHRFGNIDCGVVIKNIEGIEGVQWTHYTIDETGPVRFCATLYGKCGPHPIEQTVSLTQGCAEIDFETRADWRRCEGFMTVEMPCEQVETLYGGIPFGTEERRVDLEHYAAIRGKQIFDPVGILHRAIEGLFYAKDFAGCTVQGTSMALAAVTGDRYFTWDKEYKTLGHIVNYSVGDMADWMIPMNDIAFRSFGKHTFRHTLLVASGQQPHHVMQAWAEGLRAAATWVRPVCGSEQQRQTLPDTASLLHCDDERVRISAFYRDGEDTVLRVWEAAGETVQASIELPVSFASAQCVDLLGAEQPSQRCTLCGRVLQLTLSPHRVQTVRLR